MANIIILPENCDHIRTQLISPETKECLSCKQQFCTHPRLDHDSTCVYCGEFQTQISTEQTWIDAGYSKNAASNVVKNAKDHVKILESLGYTQDIIESAMEKFTKVGCSLSEESAVVAICVWLTCWDMGCPRTLIEVAKKHSLSKSKIKKGRKIVLSFDYFKPYRTKYITISSMICKLVEDLKINKSYYKPIYDMAKFVEKNWERLETTKRSAPQNIASACVFVYIQNSPTLSHLINTPSKKKELCAILGPSAITIDKLAKQIIDEMIQIE